MSLVFSSTANKNGIIQRIERNVFGPDGDGRITGNSTLFAYFTNDVNMALDRALSIIFNADGRWQFDDSNHTDYPIITTNLVANQRDYSFTTDGSSNLILDIYKVAILPSATATLYDEVSPADAQSDDNSVFVEASETGVPSQYDKTANGIFLNPVPNYSATNGLKVYISREGSYFTTADTTKKPGIAGIFHEYLVVEPSYRYAMANGLTNMNALASETMRLEREIEKYYSRRAKDERPIMTGKKINYI